MVGMHPSIPNVLDGYGILAQAEMQGVWIIQVLVTDVSTIILVKLPIFGFLVLILAK